MFVVWAGSANHLLTLAMVTGQIAGKRPVYRGDQSVVMVHRTVRQFCQRWRKAAASRASSLKGVKRPRSLACAPRHDAQADNVPTAELRKGIVWSKAGDIIPATAARSSKTRLGE